MKRLFFFPDSETPVGVMPSFYDEVSADQVADAIAMGGVDVTESNSDQIAYERQLAYQNELMS